MGRSIGELDHNNLSISPKYRVKCYYVNTADYGIPQIRRRIFIVGIRSDLPDTFMPPPSANQSFKSSNNYKQTWLSAKDALDNLWDPLGINNHSVPDQEKLTKATINLAPAGRWDSRLNPNSPSPTIRAEHHGHIYVHYNVLSDGTMRRLTIRECARIQGFPDTFVFPVLTTQAYKQIGNAISPVLAYYWAVSINSWLNHIQNDNELY